jgi:acetylornithine deacetylase/succinyl-diaminopimelate desuccinylase-like protein
LPGESIEDVREQLDRALGGLDYELEWLEPLEGGTESPIDTPLYRICEEFARDRLAGADLLPIVTPGFTDSHWVRREHGTVAYGFAPVFTTPMPVYLDGMHGADEAIDVADLAAMTDLNLEAIRALGA